MLIFQWFVGSLSTKNPPGPSSPSSARFAASSMKTKAFPSSMMSGSVRTNFPSSRGRKRGSVLPRALRPLTMRQTLILRSHLALGTMIFPQLRGRQMRKHLAERAPLQRERLAEEHPSRALQSLRKQCHGPHHQHLLTARTNRQPPPDQRHKGPLAHEQSQPNSPSTSNMGAQWLPPVWGNCAQLSHGAAATRAATCNASLLHALIHALGCSKTSLSQHFVVPPRSGKLERQAIQTLLHSKRP